MISIDDLIPDPVDGYYSVIDSSNRIRDYGGKANEP